MVKREKERSKIRAAKIDNLRWVSKLCLVKTMVERFVEVCSRRSLIVNGEKSEVKALGREEGSIYKDLVEGARLDHVSELKNMCGCVLDESGTDCAECRRKLESGREDNGMEGEGEI